MAFYFAVSTSQYKTAEIKSSISFHQCREHRKQLCLWARGMETPKPNLEIDFHFQNFKVLVLINSSSSLDQAEIKNYLILTIE